MMNIIKYAGLFMVVFSTFAQAQSLKNTETISFQLFNPEDSIGKEVFSQLDKFERFGHFGNVEDRAKNGQYISNYVNLFVKGAKVPDDLSDTIIGKKEITIEEYENLARKAPVFPYVLILEKQDTTKALKVDSSGFYYTTFRFFKLFDKRAIIGKVYKHAAIYSVGFKFRLDTSESYFTEIRKLEGDEFTDFKLGSYGRFIYSEILLSNDLTTLPKPLPPPYVPTSTPTKSNFFLYGGYLLTNFLAPENYKGNSNTNYSGTGQESGYSVGLKYQKGFGQNDLFGIIVGVEYEMNMYDFTQNDMSFEYSEDNDGNSLVDLEGGEYDKKYVDVSTYKENGDLSFIKPEIGLFLNFGKKKVNFQIIGAIGNAFLLQTNYSNRSITSSKGEIFGSGKPISGEHLGFYNQLETNFTGEFTEAQSYMFWKMGAGVDFKFGDRIGFSLSAEYRKSFTYVLRKNTADQAFLDPDKNLGYGSQFNVLSESRNYSAIAIVAGFKIYLNEKR